MGWNICIPGDLDTNESYVNKVRVSDLGTGRFKVKFTHDITTGI